MDTLELITQFLDCDFRDSSLLGVTVFKRSLLVSVDGNRWGLCSYDGVSSSLCLPVHGNIFLKQINFSDHFLRAVLIAWINAIYNKPAVERHLASKKKAHHFLHTCPLNVSVATIGRFPFVRELLQKRGMSKVAVFELEPQVGEFSIEEYYRLSDFDYVFITAMTLMNRTFDDVMRWVNPAHAILLGPSTPFHPYLIARGFHSLAGAVIEDGDRVINSLSHGESFRQAEGISYWSIDG